MAIACLMLVRVLSEKEMLGFLGQGRLKILFLFPHTQCTNFGA